MRAGSFWARIGASPEREFNMFDKAAFAGHESVHHFFDAKTGLRAIIALHSTKRGPGAGGCRMWNYANSDEAFTDALRLSEGMSYKNAMADLPLGGGKAVIWGNSKTDKTPDLFRALGRAIESLNGRYWSAEDVGVSVADMARLVQSADAYVSPYRAEGYNLPVLEAAAAGLPVLCTAGGATDDFTAPDFALRIEAALDEQARVLSPSLDHLIVLLRKCVEDAAWRDGARSAGPVFVARGHTWKHAAARLMDAVGLAGARRL